MPDFKPATEKEIKALRAVSVLQAQLRRIDVRLATKMARVRLARTLKAVRGMRTVTDLKWHAQITGREADSLHAIARAVKARRVFVKMLERARARLK